MNISTNDFVRIRWGLAFLLLSLVLAFAMTTTARKLVEKAQMEQRQLEIQQREIRTRLSRAPEEERELRNKIALFLQLQERGVIGQEERLNWVEQISRITAARRLFDIQYEIAPQKPLSESLLPGGAAAGDYEFMSSTMSLQMPLLHEDDLLGFLADLQRNVHAHLLVRDCAIERLAQGQERGVAAQLRAVCTIDWITLREKRQ
ncbi:MAG: hypothetical protein HZA64_04550 [Rhodocyclales bacterium]|nr:hypothetical protein [Rhodocyclales bacterium]MBI5784710.1 hypothetical protein [Rhodocyclales bacterium]